MNQRAVPIIISRALFLAVLLLFAVPRAQAHGDVHGQILELTKLIENEPGNALLYVRRGALHATHQGWDEANADYDRAFERDPALPVIQLVRGKLFLDAGWPFSARVALDQFLLRQPDHPEGFATRARAFVRLQQWPEATRDYTAAIAHSVEPGPDLFIERAQALEAAGTNHVAEALSGLDEGMKKLGPIVTLQLYAIDLEAKSKRFDRALARLEQISAQSPRKETWLARRGELLTQAGRFNEAKQAFHASLKAIERLPPTRRGVPAMMELEKRLHEAIASLPKTKG